MATMTTASPGVDMTLVVKTSTGKHFQLVVSRAASVLEFKEKCVSPSEVPANEQRLIYKGRALQDGDLLTEYDVTDQCTIHLLRAPPRQPQAPPQQPQLAANGLLAGGLFILPGALVMLALSIGYVYFGTIGWVELLFTGLKAGISVIVLQALIKLAKRGLTHLMDWMIAIVAFIGIFFADVPFPLIIASAALYGFYASHPTK